MRIPSSKRNEEGNVFVPFDSIRLSREETKVSESLRNARNTRTRKWSTGSNIFDGFLYFILHSLLGQPRRVRATLLGSVNKAARIFHLPFITHLCEHRNLTVVCSNIIRAALGGVHWRHLLNFLRDSFVCIYRVSPKFRTFSKNSWHS